MMPSVLTTDPILSVPNATDVANVPKMTKNDASVPVFGSTHFYMGFWKNPLLVP